MKVEFECVRKSVNCVHIVFNSSAYSGATVLPKPFSTSMDALLRKRLSAHTRFRYCIRSSVSCFLLLCSVNPKRVLAEEKKLCAKNFEIDFYCVWRFCTLAKRFVCDRKFALRFH